ncbi:MAG: HD-GYP domain-containing protein [Sulfuriflexus sp.]|nr:HD-GYP domain-containing protein [Sulfuriflexus sp.]
MKKKIDIADLKIGMYVAELDRPWLESPFLFQGFVVEDDAILKSVIDLCKYVIIDNEKGDDANVAVEHAPQKSAVVIDFKTRKRIPVTTPFHEELKQAKVIHKRARSQIDSMFQDARMGKSIDVSGAKEVVSGMVDSIVRNPDAQLWLSNLRKRDEYTAIHSLNVCIFALSFARYLGFNTEEMNEIGIGALMHDIGKMRVPLEILNKEGKLTEEEREIVKQHAQHGRDILNNSPGLPASVIEVAYSHHERKKGTGYPQGLVEAQIHLFSRIVAIVDVYDAITSDRVYHHGMNTLDALKNMFKWRENDLDAELVEKFIQCLGIYPIGSLVELNTGEVGIVLSMAPGKNLVPIVMLVCDEDKQVVTPPRVLDLSQFTKEKCDTPIEITKVLEANSCGIDLFEYIKHEVLI